MKPTPEDLGTEITAATLAELDAAGRRYYDSVVLDKQVDWRKQPIQTDAESDAEDDALYEAEALAE